jgi:hypothetical protein
MKNQQNAINLNNVLTYIILFLFLFYFYDVFLSSINYCDSGSINEVSDVNLDNENNQSRHLSELHFIDRVRRRISWYINPLNKEKFSSYSQFKSSWNPNTNTWNEVKIAIKEDIKRSRAAHAQRQEQSRMESERFMSNIRRTNEISKNIKLQRYIDRINFQNRKK